MKKTKGKLFGIAGILLAAFALWTLAVQHIDVQAIGPNGSSVGFAGLNGWVHDLTGVHMGLYVLTDWLGLVPIGFVLGFAVLGLVQWMRRRKLFRVDHDILLLGGFYLLVLMLYLVFETVAVNARPRAFGSVLSVIDHHAGVVRHADGDDAAACAHSEYKGENNCPHDSRCVYRVYGGWTIDCRCALVYGYYRRRSAQCGTSCVIRCDRKEDEVKEWYQAENIYCFVPCYDDLPTPKTKTRFL